MKLPRLILVRNLCLPLVLAGAALSAQAALLTTAGYYDMPNGTTAAARPELAGGTHLATRFDTLFLQGAQYPVTVLEVVSEVWRDSAGTMDFYWRIDTFSGAPHVGQLRVGNFFSSLYDADWRADSGGASAVAPTGLQFFGGATGAFDWFFFGNDGAGMTPGDTSRFMFMRTDATDYALSGTLDVTDPSLTALSNSVATFAPLYDTTTPGSNNLPEPASWSLALLGLCLAFPRRRGR